MTVHHLDCATMCPLGGRALMGGGGRLIGRLATHCLLIESGDGLILVDTGFGTEDVAHPQHRLGRRFLATVRPQLTPARTALHQIRALGHDPRDVRDIVLTHLDLDHAGGLGDFPHARVHVLADELSAARAQATLGERDRYRPAQWAHGPHWVEHRPDAATEDWYGFRAIPILPDATPDLLLVPLAGHTRGHCGVAVRTDDRWLLHAGDAYFNRADIAPGFPRRPPGLTAFQRLMAIDNPARLHNLNRLRALHRTRPTDVRIICAHDPADLPRP
ncbi:MBL fold metallo-hydrolase [Kitasatospora aureofaciens]|uniref:MBL fold metallo-hydrolase n=1 Tax=Kitasatospora aureofaciens TaxID=1894 RepID=UPI001C495D45|nr:MBL fold metallo-hydrolase [Kitasatospora aureofaciens]MBV6701897.1 MBL fold metallo-hydrolase [Kitasatospora aureofaciens]